MKMTERIGPNLSGKNHRGFRYTPKELVKKGMASFSSAHIPIDTRDVLEMVEEFEAKNGRLPTTLHHPGIGGRGQQAMYRLEDGRTLWLKTIPGELENPRVE